MSRYLVVFLFSFWATSDYAQAGRIDFKSISFEEAQTLNTRSNKLLFVTATAKWCEVCKLMDQSVFVDQRVGSLFNTNFYNLKLDIEASTGPLFALRYNVDTLPALLFLSADGTLISKTTGYKKALELVSLANQAMQPDRLVVAMQQRYEEGDRKPDFILNYIQNLPRTDPTAIILEYLRDRKTWTDEYTMDLVWRLPDSILVQHLEYIIHEQLSFEKRMGQTLYRSKLGDLVNQRLFCSATPPSIAESSNLILNSELPNAKNILANYRLYYFKEVKKDIPAYVQAQIIVWNTSDHLATDTFNEELNTLIAIRPQVSIYKEVGKVVSRASNLYISSNTLYLVAQLCVQEQQRRKAKRWIRKAIKVNRDSILKPQLEAFRNTLQS